MEGAMDLHNRQVNGSVRSLEEPASTRISRMPREDGFAGLHQELAQRRELEQSFRKSEEKLQSLLNSTVESLFLVDRRGTVQLANRTAAEKLGLESQVELIGRNLFDLFPPEVSERRRGKLDLAVQTGRVYALEDEREGRVYLAHYHPVFDESGRVVQVAIFARDVTERRNAERYLQYLAYYDQLTGLPNRELFCLRLERAVVRTLQEGLRLGLICVDMDRLKAVNDTLGHSAGDKLISETAKRLSEAVPENCTVARVGGDEFMILLENLTDEKELLDLGTRVRSAAGRPVRLRGMDIRQEVSIGGSIYPDHARDKETLVQQADISMYNAKTCPLNKVQVYEAGRDRVSHRYSLELELARALEEKQFEVHFQPLVELPSGTAAGFEALLRWRHPTKGLISAGSFVETLERSGFIREVGEWVLEQTCDRIVDQGWDRRGLRVTVNFSAQQLFCPDLKGLTVDLLRRKGIDPCCLGIEITETSALQEVDTAVQTLREFSAQGMWAILDDFGKGYSSLNILRQLPVGVVKIDKSFVQSIPGNSDDATMVASIVSLVHNMGKTVVAEGIECKEQALYLTKLGCDYGQGYYFGRPAPAEEAGALAGSLRESKAGLAS